MNKLSKILNFIGNTIGANPSTLTTEAKTLIGAINELKAGSVKILDMYPVGSYYETSKSESEFNPNTAWGGTWVLDSVGKVTVSRSSGEAEFDTLGETGGTKYVTLTANQSGIKSHSHTMAHTHGMSHTHSANSGRSYVTHSSSSDIAEKGVASGSKYTVAVFDSGDNWYGMTNTAGSSISNTGGSSAANTGAASSNASEAHTNMQPYIVVNRWHRTA